MPGPGEYLTSPEALIPAASVAAVIFLTPYVYRGTCLLWRFWYFVASVVRFHASKSRTKARKETAALAAACRETAVLSEAVDLKRPSISVQGSGMRYGWTLGVLQYVFEEFDCEAGVFVGTSSGLFPLMAIINGTQPMHWMARDWQKCVDHWDGRFTGVFLDGASFLGRLWNNFLGKDIAEKASGRLVINATVVRGLSLKPRLFSRFGTRQALLRRLLAATSIPGISLLDSWMVVDGERCCDGAFSSLAPKLSDATVLVSPFRSFQPKGFRHVLSPSTQSARAAEIADAPREGRRQRSGPFGALRRVMRVVKVCFLPPSVATCTADARRGYEDAQAAREVFLAAGWKPREKEVEGKYAWPTRPE